MFNSIIKLTNWIITKFSLQHIVTRFSLNFTTKWDPYFNFASDTLALTIDTWITFARADIFFFCFEILLANGGVVDL